MTPDATSYGRAVRPGADAQSWQAGCSRVPVEETRRVPEVPEVPFGPSGLRLYATDLAFLARVRAGRAAATDTTTQEAE